MRANEAENYGSFDMPQRALRALDETDSMSPALRECVHEFGYAIVKAFLNAKIADPKVIRRLVNEVWNGARQPAQRNRLGRQHSPVLESLDWVLLQAGSQIGARALLRVLWANSMVIVPWEPSTVMVKASMDAIKSMGLMKKETKHRTRLRVAIQAQAQRLWPHLFHS